MALTDAQKRTPGFQRPDLPHQATPRDLIRFHHQLELLKREAKRMDIVTGGHLEAAQVAVFESMMGRLARSKSEHAPSITSMKEKIPYFRGQKTQARPTARSRLVQKAYDEGIARLFRLYIRVAQVQDRLSEKDGQELGIVLAYTTDFYLSLRNSARLGLSFGNAIRLASRADYQSPFLFEELSKKNPERRQLEVLDMALGASPYIKKALRPGNGSAGPIPRLSPYEKKEAEDLMKQFPGASPDIIRDLIKQGITKKAEVLSLVTGKSAALRAEYPDKSPYTIERVVLESSSDADIHRKLSEMSAIIEIVPDRTEASPPQSSKTIRHQPQARAPVCQDNLIQPPRQESRQRPGPTGTGPRALEAQKKRITSVYGPKSPEMLNYMRHYGMENIDQALDMIIRELNELKQKHGIITEEILLMQIIRNPGNASKVIERMRAR